MNGCIGKNVGPYPSKTLHQEEKKHDERVKVENERKAKESYEKYKLEQEFKKEIVEAKLREEPRMEFADNKARARFATWEGVNRDPYGGRCVSYANEWARLMQAEIKRGLMIKQVAESTSHEADYDGITGAMFGFAKTILLQTWKYREGLKRYYEDKR